MRFICGAVGRWRRACPLQDDIRAIVDGQSQTDPQFRTQRLYTRLSVQEVRRQLIAQKGYPHENCPGRETLRLRLAALG